MEKEKEIVVQVCGNECGNQQKKEKISENFLTTLRSAFEERITVMLEEEGCLGVCSFRPARRENNSWVGMKEGKGGINLSLFFGEEDFWVKKMEESDIEEVIGKIAQWVGGVLGIKELEKERKK